MKVTEEKLGRAFAKLLKMRICCYIPVTIIEV
jgi:hypothetical protein